MPTPSVASPQMSEGDRAALLAGRDEEPADAAADASGAISDALRKRYRESAQDDDDDDGFASPQLSFLKAK
jgi:hypothetical protein